jgi:cyclic pyranopterin phosphate synthase
MFSHINKNGQAIMVNIVNKSNTIRSAKAKADIIVPKHVFNAVIENNIKKGDVISLSRIAGIIATKNVHNIIPLCHAINVDHVNIDIISHPPNKFEIIAEVNCFNKTGVEMEALHAVSVSSLTFYDMCKALSKDMCITNMHLINKTGGKSDYNITQQ